MHQALALVKAQTGMLGMFASGCLPPSGDVWLQQVMRRMVQAPELLPPQDKAEVLTHSLRSFERLPPQ